MGKTSILTIAIQLVKQGNGDKETVKALAGLRQGWTQAMGIMAAAAGVAFTLNQAYEKTVGVFVTYAGEVRNAMRATGENATEASRLIQITDDLGVSYEVLEKAIKSSADTTDFSIEGLARASEAYLQLTDAQQKAKYAQSLYGKAWVSMVAVLEKGPDAIRQMSDAVSESLVLNGAQIQSARKVEIQIDQLSDAFKGLAVTIGGGIVGAVQIDIDPNSISMVEALSAGIEGISSALLFLQRQEAIASLARQMGEADGATRVTKEQMQAATMIMETYWAATDATAAAVEGLTDATKEQDAAQAALDLQMQQAAASQKMISDHYTTFLDTIGQVQSAQDAYTQVLVEQEAVKAKLNADYEAGNITLDEFNDGIAKSQEQINAAAAEFEQAGNRIVFSLIQAKMASDGLTQAEGESLLKIGVQMGIFSQQSADMALGYIRDADAMIASGSAAGKGIVQGLKVAHGEIDETAQSTAYLKEQLDGLAKKSGSVWTYTFVLNTIGTLPSLPAGGRCFVAGTLVELANGNQRAIEQVRVGDLVVSMDTETGRLLPARIAETYTHDADEVQSTLLINGSIGVTDEHMIFVNGEWKAAVDIVVGDEMLSKENKAVSVTSVRRVMKSEPVYNLHTDHETHNYFANGVLVHNMKSGQDSGGNEFGPTTTSSGAAGGQLSGQWTLVGDGPGGQMTPYSELISPTGHVFDHTMTEFLVNSGMVPNTFMRLGGDMSPDEQAYYASRPRGDAGEWSPRGRRRGSTMSRPGGGASTTDTPAYSSVTPLVAETQAAVGSMSAASQQQAAATQAQTSAIQSGNDSVVSAINELGRRIDKLNATLPNALKEAALQVV